ncbi:hypothetical protein Ahy_B03g068543 [Arachis hypogaea]|uniref:Aminotransferase-like plant mobile domain-containing protein n=1 Tax=Arachis hypogaea TaxID=3818 RepID=A0A445AAF7_ARAHY|nr:hypothetical protein Ahy_B03g068543 [Arachis hypogaea]
MGAEYYRNQPNWKLRKRPRFAPTWVWFQELLGVLPPANQIQKFAVNCTWFQETFRECPEGANGEIVRRYARAYIMMLLGTQLFVDKSGNRIHIRWLLYMARLEEMGGYSWSSTALAWLYRCMCQVANKHVVKLAGPLQLLQSWIFWRFPGFRPAGYDTFSWPLASRWSSHNPSGSEKGPRVQMWRLRIDLLQARDSHHGGHGGEWYGSGMGDGSAHGDVGLGSGPLDDYFVGVPDDDHTLQESQPWVSLGMLFSDLLASDGLDADFGGSHFLDEISAIMQEDDAARRWGQMTGTQAPLDVDLNELPSVPPPDYFALGGTPPSAYAAGSHSVVGPSRAPVGGESVPSGSSS